jgi:DNA helicase II / ATP-dependent DNA helicase PcrA
MDSFGAVRKLARQKHAAMKALASGKSVASALLAQARIATKATVQAVPPDHPLLAAGDGALYRSETTPSIYVSNALAPDAASYVEAHEFGHFWIETPIEPAVVPRNSDPGGPEENSPTGIRRVEGYSPQELRERYANVFAREFLLPAPEARRLFALDKSAKQVAAEIGVPLGLVNQQLAVALLLPEPPEKKKSTADAPDLDASQKEAAEHEGAPLLVEAGPGAGKTRTLIARIEYLLAKGVPPAGILVLTFSNKAAREIRERVAASSADAAAEIWAGTFHGFGLEFVRKFGHLEGIREPVRLLDQADQLQFLESELKHLKLDHYLWLSEPAFALRHILGAISRAKDEVFSPDRYAEAAERMLRAAGSDEKQILRAQKAAEVAGVYHHYENRLRSEGIVDFADLINRPIEILRKNPAIRDEVRGQYVHILVDEYQDVNRASALLLKELAGDGKTLWVVGDARQSIYRFRGAAPTNTTNFERDYPNAKRKALAVNYRSREEIVKTFVTYADQMEVGRNRDNKLEAKRGLGKAAVNFNVAKDRDSEIAGLAAAAEHYKSQGRDYRDQAILCRGHSYLQKIAAGLEAAGVPVLNLGEIFEREEVRDLLSLLSFVSEPHRAGLMRLATLPRYRMPLADVQTLHAAAEEMEKTPLAALKAADAIPGISSGGKKALSQLRSDVQAVGFKTGPGQMLFDVLFERGLVRDYLGGETAADQQRRLAVHQLLQFAAENDAPGEKDPKRQFLDWIRRLAVFGDDRSLRELPTAVEGIDAVRLMTVHMSKGLEFDVVHLPGLGNGMFPFTGGGSVCPAPDGMLETPVKESKVEEEECLFFVALSRARDHLSLSRADRYSRRSSPNPSPALEVIASHLPRAPNCKPTWTTALPAPAQDRMRPDLKADEREHDGHDIETYDDCPRRYVYQVVLGLSRSRQDNGFIHFHRTIYRVLRWLAQQTGTVDAAQIKAEFDARWAETGPVGNPLEEVYRSSGEQMLDRERHRSRAGMRIAEVVSIKVDGHLVRLEIDEMEQTGRNLVVRRLRTGRAPSTPDQRLLHALMLGAVEQTLGAKGVFRIRYLSTDDERPVKLDGVMADRMARTSAALAGLAQGAYPAKPSDDCPRCPHYFICSAVPD